VPSPKRKKTARKKKKVVRKRPTKSRAKKRHPSKGKPRPKVRRTRKNSEAKTRQLPIQKKLTEKLIGEAIELIEEGLPMDSTCAYLGITEHTFHDWKEKGEKYLLELQSDRGPEFPEDEIEARFMLAVIKAKATLELTIIRDLKSDEALARWVRNMTILERRFRHSWGRNESLRVESESIAPDEAYL